MSTLKSGPRQFILFSCISLPYTYLAKIIRLKVDINMYTTVAKAKKLLKIPRREESFLKSHSVHLWHCTFYTWCHSKLPFLFTCIFLSLSANNLSRIFLWIIQQVDLVKERGFHLFSTGRHTLSITYCTPYKANQQHTNVHMKRKWGVWALAAASNFPGTSRIKGGQINESAQAHCYRWEWSLSQLMMWAD